MIDGRSMRLLLVLTGPLILHAPSFASDAVALFRRGEAAERTLCYSGVKMIRAFCADRERGTYERSVRIWHGGPGRTRLEFIQSPGGPSPVVIENGARCWLFSPRRRTWRPISWNAPEPRIDLLLKNYRLTPESKETVAGRGALRVRIEPRFLGNPRKETWLDLATGIALRSDLFDCAGRLVSRSEFLEFRSERSLPPSMFRLPASAVDPEPEPVAISRLSFEPSLPRYLPRGYVLDRLTPSRQDGTDVVRARFTDGLNTLSLVQWRGRQEPEEGRGDRFWAPGERVSWRLGPVRAVLAGDLDRAELRRVAGSIRAPAPGSSSLMTRK